MDQGFGVYVVDGEPLLARQIVRVDTDKVRLPTGTVYTYQFTANRLPVSWPNLAVTCEVDGETVQVVGFPLRKAIAFFLNHEHAFTKEVSDEAVGG